MKRLPSLAAFCLMLAPVTALAHHSFAAQYDSTKQVTLQGVITRSGSTREPRPPDGFYSPVATPPMCSDDGERPLQRGVAKLTG